jgi:hypothetical protein
MLTITDASGEAAFLYFKGAELIEANYAALWGRDALMQIVAWKLVDGTVAPLPLGIKRSLWDPIEALLNPNRAASASGKLSSLPTFTTQKSAFSSPFDRYKAIPGLLKLIQVERGKENVLQESKEPGEIENTEWLVEFAERAKSVGDTLGFGLCEKWTIDTERYQAVGVNHDETVVVLMRRKDAVQEDLDAAVDAILD